MNDPSGQPEVVAIRAVAEEDRLQIDRLVWLEDWFTVWKKEKASFDAARPASVAWGNAATKCFGLLVALERAQAADHGTLPSIRPGRRGETETWCRRLIVHYLKNGEYLGPGHRDLQPPNPPWTKDELNELIRRERWGDVRRDITRADVSLSTPGGPKPLPGTPQRWSVVEPFLLGRKVDPGIAWAHWSQLILTLSKRLAHPDMAAGPARLPDPEAARERLQAASRLLRELAQCVELVPAEEAAPERK